MIVPLPLESNGAPPKTDPAGRMVMDLPGFGRVVQVRGELEKRVRPHLLGLTPIAIEIVLAKQGDPFSGLWVRASDLQRLVPDA